MHDVAQTQWRAGWCLPKPGRVADYARARLSTPLVEAGTASEVLRMFGLDIEGRPSNLPLGWRNRNVKVRSTAGMKVLKMYPVRWSYPTIAYEHSILEHLAELDFPAVRLNRTPGGTTAVEREHRWFALFDFEPGHSRSACYLPESGHRSLLQIAGRTLAQLHRSLDGFEPDGKHHLGFESLTRNRDRDLPWLLRTLEELPGRTRDFPDEVIRDRLSWLAGRAPSIAERLTRLDRVLSGAPLPRVIIHGDYGIHNLLFQKKGTAVVHDFELARVDWRLVDLLASSARLKSPPLRKAFINAYRSENQLAEAELTYLNEIWQDYRLRGAVHSWHNFCEFGEERRLTVARRRIDQADRALEQGIVPWI